MRQRVGTEFGVGQVGQHFLQENVANADHQPPSDRRPHHAKRRAKAPWHIGKRHGLDHRLHKSDGLDVISVVVGPTETEPRSPVVKHEGDV
jgi:hypothetical protein